MGNVSFGRLRAEQVDALRLDDFLVAIEHSHEFFGGLLAGGPLDTDVFGPGQFGCLAETDRIPVGIQTVEDVADRRVGGQPGRRVRSFSELRSDIESLRSRLTPMLSCGRRSFQADRPPQMIRQMIRTVPSITRLLPA